jgi:hypothetical protein
MWFFFYIWPYFFLLNKKVLGAGSGVRVILDLCAYVWIIASCSDCLVTGYQPKSVVVLIVHVTLMMTEKVEQRNCIKFCQKLGHSCSETCDMIQKAFGNEAVNHMQVKDWFRQFREGWTSVKSDEHWGRPSMSSKRWLTRACCCAG